MRSANSVAGARRLPACPPAIVDSLPTGYHFDWQPKRAGKLPALPRANAARANANEDLPLIETGLPGRSCFPAAMDPDPLPGIRANEFFDLGGIERGSIDDVFLGVTRVTNGFD